MTTSKQEVAAAIDAMSIRERAAFVLKHAPSLLTERERVAVTGMLIGSAVLDRLSDEYSAVRNERSPACAARAIDAVLGEGVTNALVSGLYDELRAVAS